ncbi:MAG: LysR family transcriptional regulator, partial [Peptococcaceae bacterium]|nr:LysR family transcriptional regulator [Peptococcaceae bacterium]
MRMEQLKYFAEVARAHSIAIASEKLFVTQPAISIAIKNLEEELGCVLFIRSKNGIQLTDMG